MIILHNNTASLKVVLGAAKTTNDMLCVVSWQGVSTTFGTNAGIEDDAGYANEVETDGVTPVELIPAPELGSVTGHYTRQIQYISIYNSDTAIKVVTVYVDVSGTAYNLVSFSLPVGYSLIYNKDSGWAVYATDGSPVTGTVIQVLPDGTYGDIVVSSSGTVMTLLASINKAITGIWSFVSDKLRLYNVAQTFYTAFISLASANRTVTYPDKDMTVAGTDELQTGILVLRSGGFITTAVAAGTYFLIPQQNTIVGSGTNSISPANMVNILTAAYPAVTGKTKKMRIKAICGVNAVAPGITFTVGLYPITAGGGAGGVTYTAGTLVTGSGVAFTTPGATTITATTGSSFTFPSDGVYALAVVTSGTTAVNSGTHILGMLEVFYE